MKQRLDKELVARGLAPTRSQAESYTKLAKVTVDGAVELKPSRLVGPENNIVLNQVEQYVSRAGLKLASVAAKLGLDFMGKVVLDVGSSTGGFTDYALRHGAKKVIAVDVGTDQMHPSLRTDERVELHEKTDIRDLKLDNRPQLVLIDVSFISLREVLPAVDSLSSANTKIVAMVKPQFETEAKNVHKGVIKNDRLRRQIFKDFETWAMRYFKIVAKADSEISGVKGNLERFYVLLPSR